MKNKKNPIIIIAIVVGVVLILLLGIIIGFFNARIPSNPAGTVGNTAGNINNSGLFCEHDGRIYFANSYDNNHLYSMSPTEGDIRKLNDISVCNILAGGKYLYYFSYSTSESGGFGSVRAIKSFNRSKLNGQNTVSLTREVVTKAQLVDDYIYMLVAGDTPEFYKMKIDKSENTLLANYEINPACAENGTIYYNGTLQDHYLYGLETTKGISYEVWQGNIWYPIKQGDYIYYLDVAENYRLCRYSLSQNIVEVLTNERVDCFNIGNGYIYYQTNGNAPALKWMNTDGSNVQTVAEGIYTNINMTSQYVYFQDFRSEITTFHSVLGSNSYEEFASAKAASFGK